MMEMKILARDFFSEWAIMSTTEAEKIGYGCELCLEVIKRAKKMDSRVIGYRNKCISPKWEILGIIPGKGEECD